MKRSHSIKKSTQIIFASACLVYGFALHAGELDKIIETGEKRTDEGKAAQQKIDKLSNAVEDLSDQYKQAAKVLDGLRVYNSLLQTQINSQGQQFDDIKNSTSEVAQIERQIVPLMVRMIDSLEKFKSGNPYKLALAPKPLINTDSNPTCSIITAVNVSCAPKVRITPGFSIKLRSCRVAFACIDIAIISKFLFFNY